MLGFFSNLNSKSTFKKTLKIPDSLDFLDFLHTHFYVCRIRIFTKQMVTQVCHMYGIFRTERPISY